jgi:glycosyltransferase involved in cell wall biosynthesis/SAM-dependent methyltransferase
MTSIGDASYVTTEAVEYPDSEAAQAKRYWSVTEAQGREHAQTPPHIMALAELCLEAGATRILEFGCYGGRNLQAIREAYGAAGKSPPELLGLDINAMAVAWGRERWKLDLRVADEDALASLADDSWDVAFTVSVLDHMPEPTETVEELVRIARRRVIILEPHAPAVDSGTVTMVRSRYSSADDEVTPYTYIHDYSSLFLGLPVVQELDLPMPTHLVRLGPFYRLRSFAKRGDTSLRHLIAACGERIACFGLPERVAARLPASGIASEDGPVLRIVGRAEALEAVQREATPEDIILSPAYPADGHDGSDDDRSRPLGTTVDGFLRISIQPDRWPRLAVPLMGQSQYLADRIVKHVLIRAHEKKFRRPQRAQRVEAGSAPATAPAADAARTLDELRATLVAARQEGVRRERRLAQLGRKLAKASPGKPGPGKPGSGKQRRSAIARLAKGIRRLLGRLWHRAEVVASAKPPSRAPDLAHLLAKSGPAAVVSQAQAMMGCSPETDLALARAAFLTLRGADRAAALTFGERVLAAAPDDATAAKVAQLHLHFGNLVRAQDILAHARQTDDVQQRHARVASQVRLWRHGFPLPARRSTPAYAPVPGRVMAVLHYSQPQTGNGYAVRSHELLTGLRNYGRDVVPVTRLGFPEADRRIAGEKQAEDSVGEIVYRRLPRNGLDIADMPRDLYLEAYADGLVAMASHYRPQLLHAASNHLNGLAANAAAATLGLKSIYEARGLWELTLLSSRPDAADSELFQMQVRLETQAALDASLFFAITGALRDEFIGRGVPAERIVVVPNGVDPERFAPQPRDAELEAKLGLAGKTVIGYVGSMVAYEGLDDLLRAIAMLKERVEIPFAALLVGDGQQLEALKAQAAQLGLMDIVLFTGRVGHDLVRRYYSLIDIAPLPRKPVRVCEIVSPLKPFEAMAMEKALVVSSVAALTEIVEDDVTGLIHRKGDVEHLARVLERLLREPELRARLARAAGAWVRRERDWRAIARIVDNAYAELMQ